jgi:hypothetical protein
MPHPTAKIGSVLVKGVPPTEGRLRPPRRPQTAPAATPAPAAGAAVDHP